MLVACACAEIDVGESQCMMSMEVYAPTVYKALNGVFCVYKPPGQTVDTLMRSLRMMLARGNHTDTLHADCANVLQQSWVPLRY